MHHGESQTAPPIRLLLAGPEARSRLHLRRLLTGAGIEIVGHVRPGTPMQETIQRTGANALLADAVDDSATAMPAALTAARMSLRVLVLTGEHPPPIPPELAGIATLGRPASLEAELPNARFGTTLRERLLTLAGSRPASARPVLKPALRPLPATRPVLIAIGSSTGGPQALPEVLKRLAGRLRQPLVITQHMPATFTHILAEHLTRHTGIPTVEAAEGMPLQTGRAYLAPGGHHLLIQRQGEQMICRLDDGPPENFCKPAVDPMLRSVIAAVGGKAMAVILTGMGHDGLLGCQALTAAGGTVLAQDEATSVVWGMPGAVAQAGLCQAVLPLNRIGDEILALAAAGA